MKCDDSTIVKTTYDILKFKLNESGNVKNLCSAPSLYEKIDSLYLDKNIIKLNNRFLNIDNPLEEKPYPLYSNEIINHNTIKYFNQNILNSYINKNSPSSDSETNNSNIQRLINLLHSSKYDVSKQLDSGRTINDNDVEMKSQNDKLNGDLLIGIKRKNFVLNQIGEIGNYRFSLDDKKVKFSEGFNHCLNFPLKIPKVFNQKDIRFFNNTVNNINNN